MGAQFEISMSISRKTNVQMRPIVKVYGQREENTRHFVIVFLIISLLGLRCLHKTRAISGYTGRLFSVSRGTTVLFTDERLSLLLLIFAPEECTQNSKRATRSHDGVDPPVNFFSYSLYTI